MVRSRYFEVVDKYLVAYIDNDAAGITAVIADDAVIDYSTIGKKNGKSEITKALSWKETYDIRTVTTSNVMSYADGDNIVIALMAHFLIADEWKKYLYPLSFGGKFVFKIDATSSLIREIVYVQEYQVENTLYIRDWKLASRVADLSATKLFDLDKKMEEIQTEEGVQKFEDLVKVFFWAFDQQDYTVLRSMASDNIHLLRYKTYSYGQFETTGIDNINLFIEQNREYYAQDNFAITIRNIEKDGDDVIVTASHLLPQRTGTKKLNVNTKYHSFYDEDITIRFILIDGSYQISDISMVKMADVQYNGYKLLHA